jgi:hypothetical protein
MRNKTTLIFWAPLTTRTNCGLVRITQSRPTPLVSGLTLITTALKASMEALTIF